MRSYLIDEISLSDMEKIDEFLKQNAIRSNLEMIFWVKIPEDLLSDIQYQHRECEPHVFAIELGADWIKLEFFVRNLKDLQCVCSGYCTPQQRVFILNYAHKIIKDLDLRT